MDKKDCKYNDSVYFKAGCAYNSMVRKLNGKFKNKGCDFTVEQMSILSQLWKKDGQTQQELACSTGRDKPGTTRLIDNMEKNNLLVRIPDKNDRRVNLIYLSSKGKDIREHAIELWTQTMEEALENIDEEKIQTCKDVLNSISHNLESS